MIRFLLFAIGLFGFVQVHWSQIVVKGSVYNRGTDAPVPNVLVEVHETEAYTFTDQEGHFQLELRPGSYHLHFISLGFRTEERTVTLSSKPVILDIRLTPTHIELKQVTIEEDLLRSGLKDRPLNIEVVDEAYMRKNASGNFASTLSRIPGITSINTGTSIGKPVIRGMSFNRVIVNHHGIKQEGQQWGSDHGLEIDQYDADRMEIIKGPASLLYGSDGIGGVINILPGDPPDQGVVRSEATGFYRSNNDLQGITANLEGNVRKTLFGLRYTHQRFNDYRVPASSFIYNTYELPIFNERLKNTAGKEHNVSAMFGRTGEWGNVRINASVFSQEAGLFAGAIGIPRAYQLSDDGDPSNIDLPRQVNRHAKAILNGKFLLGKGWWHVDLGAQQNLRREESLSHTHGNGPAPTGNLAHWLELFTYSLNSRYHLNPTDLWKLVFGVQGQYQQNQRDGFEYLLPDYKGLQAGGYVFAEWKNTEKSTFSGGLRYDYGYMETPGGRIAIYNSDTSIIGYDQRTPAFKGNYHNWSGSLGWSYRPLENWNIKINLGKSFRMPNAAELMINGVHHGTFRHEKGDTALQSEHGYQLDVGLHYTSPKWLLKVTPYFNYFPNYLYLSPSGSFSLLPDAGQIYQYKQTEAIYTGLEVFTDIHPIEHLHIELGVAYVFNYNLNTFLGLPFTPPLQIQVNPSYDWEWSRGWLRELTLGAGIQITAVQNRTDRNEPVTPGYALMQIMAQLEMDWGLVKPILLIRGDNLLDARYMNHLSRYRILNLPEPGRTISISLSIPVTWSKPNEP